MRVAVIGHSYVRDLGNYGKKHPNEIPSKIKLTFFSQPGADYLKLLQRDQLFAKVGEFDPHIVICILIGNEIKNSRSYKEIIN